MTASEIKEKIAKLEKGLSNPKVPEAFKATGREEIKKLKAELEKITSKKTPVAKPTPKPKATPKPKPTPVAKHKKTMSKSKSGLTASQKRIQQISKLATKIQKEGGMKESEACKKMIYKINRADAVKKAAKEIRYDAGNKNRSGFMDGTSRRKKKR